LDLRLGAAELNLVDLNEVPETAKEICRHYSHLTGATKNRQD
jgi:hypothetical protein